VLMLFFLIPLSLELPEVLRLWLKNPPPYTIGLCWYMMAMLLVDKASIGHCLACNASGRIAGYQATGGMLLILCLPLAWLFATQGCGVYFVGVSLLITAAANALSRVFFAQRICGLSIRYWVLHIILPVGAVTLLASIPGVFIVSSRQPSFSRIVLTTLVSEAALIPLVWFVTLDRTEKSFVVEKLRKVKTRWLHA